MSGWDGWAANVMANGADGAALYDPKSGAIWGRAGSYACDGNMQNYDEKAGGKDACCPTVNGAKFMFIRKTLDDDIPCSIFKKGQDNLVTMKGPSGSRVAVFTKDKKPEQSMNAVVTYLKNAGV